MTDTDRTYRITPPMRDLRRAAVYIERDGARRVPSVEATRLGLTLYAGPLLGDGHYSFTVDDADQPALSAARDLAYREVRDRQLGRRR